jgi:alpha/beta superfamily hydrolase
MRAPLRVQFIHGLEGSPQGAKARLFARTFEALTPPMNTSDFEGCVRQHANTLASFRPDVLVGSSFGGAVAVALLQRGAWSGPTMLLAQAAVRRGLPVQLPADVHVWLVHGRQDEIIDVEDSRRLADSSASGLVRLIEVDDDHSLHGLVDSGRLVELVRELYEAAQVERERSHRR